MSAVTSLELSGRVALIAGAARPLGRAIADRFGAGGAALALPLFDDWPEANEDLKAQFDRAGYEYICPFCDLTSAAQTGALLAAVRERWGALDYLINNIERGGMPVVHGPYDLAVNRDQWQLEMTSTLTAKHHLYQASFEMLRGCRDGALVNISSIAARVGRCGPAAPLFSDGYSAANAAIAAFTRQWARELAPGVRVNEVMLGLVDGRHGQGTRGWALLDDDQRRRLTAHTLAGRTALPGEVAEFVYFLAVHARYLTGAVIPFDGGYLCGGEAAGEMGPGVLG